MTTTAGVAARAARLERRIIAISNGASHTDSSVKSISAVTSSLGEVRRNETQTVGASPEELLLQDGHSVRSINEVLISRVSEEVSLAL